MKTWFITNACSGYAARIAKKALESGHNVVATAHNVQRVLDTLGKHPNLVALQLDITDDFQVSEAVDVCLNLFGGIDVLVNGEGHGLFGAIEEASLEEVEKLYRNNVFGPLGVCRAILPHMRSRHSGLILNVSSICGYRGSVASGLYSSSKFALEGLSEALAAEVRPLGIQVTILELGEHHQLAELDRLAEVAVRITDYKQGPLRLALGSETVSAIESKNRLVQEELERWRELSASTDFAKSA